MKSRFTARNNKHEGSQTNKKPVAKTGVLLTNLGSPAAPTTGAVRKYLREFYLIPELLKYRALFG